MHGASMAVTIEVWGNWLRQRSAPDRTFLVGEVSTDEGDVAYVASFASRLLPRGEGTDVAAMAQARPTRPTTRTHGYAALGYAEPSARPL